MDGLRRERERQKQKKGNEYVRDGRWDKCEDFVKI